MGDRWQSVWCVLRRLWLKWLMCLRLVHLLLQGRISQEHVLILLKGFWGPSILVEIERPRSVECRILHSC